MAGGLLNPPPLEPTCRRYSRRAAAGGVLLSRPTRFAYRPPLTRTYEPVRAVLFRLQLPRRDPLEDRSPGHSKPPRGFGY
jgi:hypothetical protein